MAKVIFGEDAWLIAYDIREPRRLARIHRSLKKVAVPLQYSIFLTWMSDTAIERLVDLLNEIIDPSEDDVRLYHLPQQTELFTMGRQWLPGDSGLFDDNYELNSRYTEWKKASSADPITGDVLFSFDTLRSVSFNDQ